MCKYQIKRPKASFATVLEKLFIIGVVIDQLTRGDAITYLSADHDTAQLQWKRGEPLVAEVKEAR